MATNRISNRAHSGLRVVLATKSLRGVGSRADMLVVRMKAEDRRVTTMHNCQSMIEFSFMIEFVDDGGGR